MTLPEIAKRLLDIKKCALDDEAAHGMEDDLYRDFVKFVATLKHPVAKKAKLLLFSEKIKFERWTG